MKIYVDIGGRTWGWAGARTGVVCPAEECFPNKKCCWSWLTVASTHPSLRSGGARCSTKLSLCNGRCHLAWPGSHCCHHPPPPPPAQLRSGSKNLTQLKVTGEWDMRNLCEVIEQPVWETSNHRRGKNFTRSDNLNPGDTEWVSVTVSSLLLLRNMNTIFLRLFVCFWYISTILDTYLRIDYHNIKCSCNIIIVKVRHVPTKKMFHKFTIQRITMEYFVHPLLHLLLIQSGNNKTSLLLSYHDIWRNIWSPRVL